MLRLSVGKFGVTFLRLSVRRHDNLHSDLQQVDTQHLASLLSGVVLCALYAECSGLYSYAECRLFLKQKFDETNISK